MQLQLERLGQALWPYGRRSLVAAFAVAGLVWLCLGGPASAAAPANDDFADAAALTPRGLDASALGTNVEATSEPGEPNHAGSAGGHSVWWTWTASRSGVVYFHTCYGSWIDTVLAVYTGTRVGALREVASNDDGCGTGSQVGFRARAGTTYRIAVDGARGEMGQIGLDEYSSPLNDDFENAALLGGRVSPLVTGLNSGATSEPGEPNHAGRPAGQSVWWRWRAPASGSARVKVCGYFGTTPDAAIAVYTGAAIGTLSAVASNESSPVGFVVGGCPSENVVDFGVRAGCTYHIAVDGPGMLFALRVSQTAVSSGPSLACPPTAGDDTLTGTAEPDVLCGLRGSDLIKGMGGNDTLFGDACGAGARPRPAGGGDDTLFGGRGDDRLFGGRGGDALYGRRGNDLLDGNTGHDRLRAGPGNDTIRAGDGRRDNVNCGPGRDSVAADRRDQVAGDCEQVTRSLKLQ